MTVRSLSIDAGDLQYTRRVTKANVFRIRTGTLETGSNSTIPGDQLRVHIPVAYCCYRVDIQNVTNPPPNCLIFLHPSLVLLYVKPHSPRRSLVIPANSRGKAVFRCFDVKRYDYPWLDLVADCVSNIALVCDNALAYSNFLQVDVSSDLIFAVKVFA